MTEWTRLMVILALVNTVQWPNSTAQQSKDNNSYLEGHLRSSERNRPKITSISDQDTTENEVIESSSEDKQIDEPAMIITNMNVRDLPPVNLNKSMFKKENIDNFIRKKPSYIRKLYTKKNPQIPINILIPGPQEIKKCLLNETYCTNVDNYPSLEITNHFRTSKFMSPQFFGTDTATSIVPKTLSKCNLESFCKTEEEIIFPRLSITENDEWRFILQDPINTNTSFKQGIRVEKCSYPDTMCKNNGHLPVGFKSVCVQQYFYKKLVSISGRKEFYFENFKFKSHCECMYKRIDELTNR